eukprot:2223701-Prymnesium_polylepis.1
MPAVFEYAGFAYAACICLEDVVILWCSHQRVCRARHVENLIWWLDAASAPQAGAPAIVALKHLARVGWARTCLVALYVHYTSTATKGFDFCGAVASITAVTYTLAWSRVVWSCLLWLWVVGVMHAAAHRFVERITLEDVLTFEIMGEHFELMNKLESVSATWSASHAVRTVTGILTATVNATIMFWEHGSHGTWTYGFQVCAAYLVVWLTALAPGYLNDRLSKSLILKIATTVHVASATTRHQLAANTLMQRVKLLEDKTGMHFAGVPMTLGRAFTVGSMIGACAMVAARCAQQ